MPKREASEETNTAGLYNREPVVSRIVRKYISVVLEPDLWYLVIACQAHYILGTRQSCENFIYIVAFRAKIQN